MRKSTRREFLRTGAGAVAAALAAPRRLAGAMPRRLARPPLPRPEIGWHGDSSVAAALRAGSLSLGPPGPPVSAAPLPVFDDLRRHFVIEYYPWYAADPWRHWDAWDRVPPVDVAANAMPRLGPYDCRSRQVLETQARWIADAGVGAVNLSWWGPGSFEDRVVHPVMDVLRDHDLKVCFHLEPYADERADFYAADVLYLLREYGEKRGFDALLVLRNTDGSEGPVFKSFRTVLPETVTDCHGVTGPVSDYTSDGAWLRQTDRLRSTLRHDFDHVTLLADSLDFERTRAAGFDGIAVYDNFVPPETYAGYAEAASRFGLVFSFNVNAGFDAVELRTVEPDSCYEPAPFVPQGEPLDWDRRESREQAAVRAVARIEASLGATLTAQSAAGLANAGRGFLLVYVNSFNEWHEGTAFEPMQDWGALSPAERAIGYHNPDDGQYRLRALRGALAGVVAGATRAARAQPQRPRGAPAPGQPRPGDATSTR